MIVRSDKNVVAFQHGCQDPLCVLVGIDMINSILRWMEGVIFFFVVVFLNLISKVTATSELTI
jgi:hypothetical protein